MGASQVNGSSGSCGCYHNGHNENGADSFNNSINGNKNGMNGSRGSEEKGPQSDELHEKLALKDFETGAGADSLDGAYNSVMAGLDKLEQDGYDVSDLKEQAKQLHEDGNKGALKTMSEGMAEEIESGGIASRIPGNEDHCGDGHGGGDEVLERLAAKDFEQTEGADKLSGTNQTLQAGLDKLEAAGYDVSDVRELADQAFEDRDVDALKIIAKTLGEEIDNGTIENRLPEDDASGDDTGGDNQEPVFQ